RPEWLAGVGTDRQIVSQPPSPDGAAALRPFEHVAVFGRADVIDPDVAARLGIAPTERRIDADFWVCHGDRDDVPPFDRPYLAEHVAVDVADDTAIHYSSRHTPLLTTRGAALWWQPTDWS